MSFSTLTNEVRSSSQRSSREGATIDHIILHHSAATNAEMVLDMMVSGSRQVSSNYVIGNDGIIYGVVDEEDRAWTSGSSDDGGKGAAWDRRSITFECLDLSVDGWTISDASYRSIAAVMADVAKRYGFELVRDGANSTVFGHKDLWNFFEASYPTACPGGMDVDHVTNLANNGSFGPSSKENHMASLRIISDPVWRAAKQQVVHNGQAANTIPDVVALAMRQGGVECHDYDDSNAFQAEISTVWMLGGLGADQAAQKVKAMLDALPK